MNDSSSFAQEREAPSPAATPVVRKRIGRPPGPTRWTADALARLKSAYESDAKVREVAQAFNVDMGSIQRFARLYGWKRRFTPESIAHMTAARRIR